MTLRRHDDDASPVIVHFGRYGDADASAWQLPETIPDLKNVRDQLAGGDRAWVIVDACVSANLNHLARQISVLDASTLLHDLAHTGATVSTFSETPFAAGVPLQGVEPSITAWPPTGQPTSSLLTVTPPSVTATQLPRGGANQFDFGRPGVRATPSITLPAAPQPVSPLGLSGPFTLLTLSTSGELLTFPAPVLPWAVASLSTIAMRLEMNADLRRYLLRLIDGMLAAGWLAQIHVRAALTRHPDARCFVLVLLAAVRCYGHRGEPDHYLLLDQRPQSIVRGGLVLAC